MLRSALPAVLVLVPLLSGCLAAAGVTVGVVSVGVVQWHRNEAQQDFPNDLQEAWKGALDGLQRLGIEPAESVLGPTEGCIVDGDIRVLVERHPEGFTRVRVRVGTFHTRDHERRSQIVLQEIAAGLERQDELRAWAEKVEGQEQPVEPETESGVEPEPNK